MYIYIIIYRYIYIYACIYKLNTYISMSICMHICMHVYVYTHAYIHSFICIYMYIDKQKKYIYIYRERNIFGYVHICFTRGYIRHPNSLMTNTELYSFQHRRKIIPLETLRMLGYGDVDVQGLDHDDIRDLAGESMSLPCLSVILLAIVLGGNLDGLWAGHKS